MELFIQATFFDIVGIIMHQIFDVLNMIEQTIRKTIKYIHKVNLIIKIDYTHKLYFYLVDIQKLYENDL